MDGLLLKICFLSLVLLWGISAFLIVSVWKQIRLELQSIQKDIARIKRENKIISAGAYGVGQRIVNFEQILQELSWRQDKQELRQSDVSSYSHASKMAEMGAGLDEIIQSCGLSRAEAELVMVLKSKHEVI